MSQDQDLELKELRTFVLQSTQDYPLKDSNHELYAKMIAWKLRNLAKALRKKPSRAHWRDYSAVVLTTQSYSSLMSKNDSRSLVGPALWSLKKLVQRMHGNKDEAYPATKKAFSGQGEQWIRRFGNQRHQVLWGKLSSEFKDRTRVR